VVEQLPKEPREAPMVHRLLSSPAHLILLVSIGTILSSGSALESAFAISQIKQSGVPAELSLTEAAVLEDNEAFLTLMTRYTVRSVAKHKSEIIKRDEAGDRAFIESHRDENADYWYWAHQKARQALVLALGKQPAEAIVAISAIPYTEYLVPEYAWIATPEFKKYLEGALEDLAYLQEPYLGVEVFLTNYQVSQLEREYRNVQIKQGPQRGRVIKPVIPMIEVNIRDLVASPRKGEEDKVGLDAFLKLPGGMIYESLLPTSKEFRKQESHIQEKLITASDSQLKRIPVSSHQSKDLLEIYMSANPPYDRFLLIEGSMLSSDENTRFSDDMKVVVNPNSFLAKFLNIHRQVFASSKVKKAQ
jgi:hypothetical protein